MNVTFPGESLLTEIVGLGREFITDKDKLAELQYKALELSQNLKMAALTQKTVPWVDAVVKLLVFARPMGAAAMTAFGAYAHWKGIDLGGEVIHTVFDGAFPAWGASRHVNKNTEVKEKERTKQVLANQQSWGWEDE